MANFGREFHGLHGITRINSRNRLDKGVSSRNKKIISLLTRQFFLRVLNNVVLVGLVKPTMN